MSVSDFFMLFSAIIFLGWLGQVFFDRTRIPDVLLLIGLGILLGPVLGILPAETLRQSAPYFGTLALIIILFEGGLRLNIRDLLHQLAPASLLTVLAFFSTCGALGSLAHFSMGLDWPASFLFGAILSGAPSGVIALPVVSRMSVPESTRTVVSLESSLSDIIAILAVVMTLGVLAGGGAATGGLSIPKQLLATFSLAGINALVVGLSWLAVLNIARGHALSYMLTLGVLFLSYAVTEKMGGSGALAVLLTGAVVANAENVFMGMERRMESLVKRWGIPEADQVRLTGFLRFKRHFAPIDDSLLRFNGEVSFVVRTFFFVFLGAVARAPKDLTAWVLLGLAFFLAMSGRALAVWLFTRIFGSHRSSLPVYVIMAPRGLAAAVLATMPMSQGIAGTEGLPDMAFGFIVLSNLVLTLGFPLVEAKMASNGTGSAAAGQNGAQP